LFFPNQREHVETVLKQVEAEKLKKEKNEKAVVFLKDVFSGKLKNMPAEMSSTLVNNSLPDEIIG